MPGTPVNRENRTHLLEHVTVVVDAGTVNADRHPGADSFIVIQRLDTTAQRQVGTAVVADMGAGVRHQFDIFRRHPVPMTQGHPWSQESPLIQIFDGCGTTSAARILLLVWRLQQVHVQGYVVGLGIRHQFVEGLVGTSGQVRRCQFNADQGFIVISSVKIFKKREIIIQSNG